MDFAGIVSILSLIMCYVAGAFVGNWIGRRIDYKRLLSP